VTDTTTKDTTYLTERLQQLGITQAQNTSMPISTATLSFIISTSTASPTGGKMKNTNGLATLRASA